MCLNDLHVKYGSLLKCLNLIVKGHWRILLLGIATAVDLALKVEKVLNESSCCNGALRQRFHNARQPKSTLKEVKASSF